MKEITQAVLDATYDKPLGRGLLRWRILELDGERAETKHIVELDIAACCFKIKKQITHRLKFRIV